MNPKIAERATGENVDSSVAPRISRTAGPHRSAFGRLLFWLLETIPTALVLGALGVVAYWGHHSGWEIPKFSEMTDGAAVEAASWCAEHNVPESECIECIPTLMPNQTDYGWCNEHGVHQCPLCHPDVAQLKTTPQIRQSRLRTASLALAVRDRKENNLGCVLYRNRVQFVSHESVTKAGIDVELVETRPVVETVSANGEIMYDETRVAHLAPRVPGTIWRVDKSLGDRVQKGDVLALVDAAEVGAAKASLLDALAQVDFHAETVGRITPLYEKQIITRGRMMETKTALQQANIRLRQAEQTLGNLGLSVSVEDLQRLPATERSEQIRFLGVPESIRGELSSSTATSNLIPLVASLDGVVIYRETAAGEVVSPSQMLFHLADTSRMWLRFNVSLEDARHLTLGQAVRFQPDGTRETVKGKLSWISTDVDKQTRTVEVRADVDNADGKLRNETFGSGEIILRESPDAVAVPQEAVQWDGSCFIVFVRDKDYFEEGNPKVFHTRTVRPGVTKDGYIEIIAGVLPGEVVATKGSAVMRSQILKNNLGPGCTCGH